MNKQRIIAVHLLNDFSGSPLVLQQALTVLQQQNLEVHLFTATPSGNGFLSGLTGVVYHPFNYRWYTNKYSTLFFYVISQCMLFFRLLFFLKRTDHVYINSLLPFGAALAARLRRCTITCHIHEVSIRPALLKKWLLTVVKRTASQCIYVSDYVRQQTAVRNKGLVIYNSLPPSFTLQAAGNSAAGNGPFTVLMVCSLKLYKGVQQFITCAAQLPAIRFELVLNATTREIEHFFAAQARPANLFVFPVQPNVAPFYQRASMVVNCSLPDQWVETFGMTILEAMYYAKPVIVPPIGGVTELVQHGVQGYCVDSRQTARLVHYILDLSANPNKYAQMSRAAEKRAASFSAAAFSEKIIQAFQARHILLPAAHQSGKVFHHS